MQKRCAIIGAGVSGLPSARWAKAYGIEPVVFDKLDRIGGLWIYKPVETDIGSVMKSTIINTSKEMTAYSDFPPPADYANFMHNRQMLSYFEQYTEHHGLYPHIRFRHTVLSIRRADDYATSGKWRVEFRDDNHPENGTQVEIFDCVLLCQGHHAKPNYTGTDWPGRDSFQGNIIHSHGYKDSKGFEDSVSVVVGVGNSGVDVAVELSRVCKQVYVSTRRGVWVMNRVGTYGQPYDMETNTRYTSFLMKMLPISFLEYKLTKNLQRRFDHAKFGLMPKFSIMSAHPTANDELPNRIISGTAIVKPNIKAFTKTGIIWENGTETPQVDNVVLATGYYFDFSLLENGELIPCENNKCRLYKNMYPVALFDHNTAAVIGLIQPLGSIMPVVEMQARVFFDVFTGHSKLPTPQAMIEEIDCMKKGLSKRYVDSPRHTIQVDLVPYMDELGSMIGCVPRPLDYIFTDPKLAYCLFFNGNLAYAYRLRGPHTWSGARDAICNAQERVDKALKTRDPGVEWKDNSSYYITAAIILFIALFWTFMF
ncbi:flavin-binding monooxygenase-like domain-containing protein [Ditylenchus destructor]|uniref:Flavin-containing monooxygenase n=1 Tax=Ditylenchus destructor TaxID=166010 RepID=A0AAD4MN54_9BILA|nr:flavin-binding monooxygenase-like domain-containing protein [Ditylenchus destructor]